jgi:hypothetical protein
VRGRVAMVGIIAFAVIMGSYLAYRAGHPYHWTLDPVDPGVYQSGGLIVRHVRWLGGLFFNGGRTGFVGWEGNQPLRALLTRLAGSGAAGWTASRLTGRTREQG